MSRSRVITIATLLFFVFTQRMLAQYSISGPATACDSSFVTFAVTRPPDAADGIFNFLAVIEDTNPNVSTIQLPFPAFVWLTGQSEKIITANTTFVSTPVEVKVRASDVNGNVAVATVQVFPNLVTSLSVSPTTITSTSLSATAPPATGTVSTTCPLRGAVSLSSDNSAASVPPFVNLLGAQSANFPVKPGPAFFTATGQLHATISATTNRGDTHQTIVTVLTPLPPNPNPVFSITPIILGALNAKSPAPVQVVFNPHSTLVPLDPSGIDPGPFDLVLGKATAFLAGVHVDRPDLVPSRGVEVQVTFDGQPPFPSVFVVPHCPAGQNTNCFDASGNATAVINTKFVPSTAGENVPVRMIVNPFGANHITEDSESQGGTASSVNVNVKATNTLRLAYVQFLDCLADTPCYGTVQDFHSSVLRSNDFIQRTYPISETGLVSTESPSGIRGSAQGDVCLNSFPVLCTLRNKRVIAEDMSNLVIKANSTSSIPFVFGVVPAGYFAYHGLPHTHGITLGKISLIQENLDTAGAHELGHQFGFNNFPVPEEYTVAQTCSSPPCPGNPAFGFWVNEPSGGLFIDKAFCFMGNQKFFDDLGQAGKTWVDQEHYQRFFTKLKTNPADPEVLLITGILGKDGSLELQPWLDLPDGIATESEAGDLVIQTLDAKGQVINFTTQQVSFVYQLEPDGPVEGDFIPIAVSVPYSPSVASLNIARAGTVLAHVNIAGKLLRDGVNALPDAAFHAPEGDRTELLEQVSHVEEKVAKNQLDDAIRKLEELRRDVVREVLDTFPIVTGLEFTKAQVLSVIDLQLQHLHSQLSTLVEQSK